MVDIKSIKAQIRSVLLSLGKTATEQEFKKGYYEIEGKSFSEVLVQLNLSFQELFHKIPDVARIIYAHNQVFIQRVSNEATSHMENLTINKYSKNYRGPKLITKSGAIKGRPMSSYPLSVNAPVYQPYFKQTNSIRKPIPYQQRGNHNMKFTVGTNNNTPNNQCFFSDNARRFNSKPTLSANPSNYSQTSNYENISSTSTKKELSSEHPVKAPEKPQSPPPSSINVLMKTSRMLLSSSESKSTINDSSSNKADDDFNDSKKIMSSNSDYETASDKTLSSPQQTVQPKKAIPTASTTSQLKSVTTNIIRSSKAEESSKLTKVIDKLENLRLSDTDEIKTSSISPNLIRERLKHMRLFREALSKDEKSSECTESVNDFIVLPDPILNEEEVFFHIKIIDVASPDKFIFQFSFDKLNELNSKMNDFYSTSNDLNKYQDKNLVNDNIVAVRCNDFWYRGQIKSFNATEVNVQLVDFMKIQQQTVKCTDIYHLHQKFMESPKSMVGRLHGLKATNGVWNISATAKLSEFVDKILLATVKSINNGVYSLSVVTNVRSYTRLCDIIKDEGLAQINLEDFTKDPVFRSLV